MLLLTHLASYESFGLLNLNNCPTRTVYSESFPCKSNTASYNLFFFCVCLQVVTSPRLEWTSRSGQWWSMGRRWSCRSGIRQDRSASAPSPPREYRQGWITHTRNNTHTHGELQYFFTRPTFMIVWASTSQRLESFPCSFWNLMGFPTDLNYTF